MLLITHHNLQYKKNQNEIKTNTTAFVALRGTTASVVHPVTVSVHTHFLCILSGNNAPGTSLITERFNTPEDTGVQNSLWQLKPSLVVLTHSSQTGSLETPAHDVPANQV